MSRAVDSQEVQPAERETAAAIGDVDQGNADAAASAAAAAAAAFHVNLSVTVMCPECKQNPPDIVERFSDGDMVCANCGLVLGSRVVDTRSEWRTFANDDQGNDDPSRVGDASNPLLDGSQLDTMISMGAPGSSLGRDLGRLQSRSIHDRKDTALQSAFGKITQMCEAYQLPKMVQDTAKEIYKIVVEHRRLRGKSQESIMAGSIFMACRLSGVARTFKEIWALTSVPRKDIGKVFKIMERILLSENIKLSAGGGQVSSDMTSQSLHTSAEDLVRRFCSHLGLSSQTTNAAEHIVRRANQEGTLAGRSPISIAAAAIYMAAALFGQHTHAIRISDRTGVSDGTIKTSYKFLWQARDRLIDDKWISSGKASMDRLPKV